MKGFKHTGWIFVLLARNMTMENVSISERRKRVDIETSNLMHN